MDEYESLSHSAWECKYHVVFIPKYRRKTMYAELRRHLDEVFRRLAEQKESRIEERCGFRGMPITVPGSSRSRFRGHADQDSGVMAITIPG